ncbi:hypothetical protein [Thermosinus carboxydivorans]|uniref:hypothetical protein n=1 Tax=Thermosinus carboxydivorans TaxID=261685 RepID=UPI0006807081|nr:hypothetical protein [Thermosinus carboxydivorans]
MAWIELHQAIWTHRKTLLLAAELDLDETYAAAHMIRLWTWALDNAPTGELTGLPAKVIAYGAGWRDDPNTFVNAAIHAGWLDKDGDRLFIHDWQDYAGRLIEKRRANAERMRKARADDVAIKNKACALHVQCTTSACAGATVPNHTVPNQINNIYTLAQSGECERVQQVDGRAAGQDPDGSVEAEKVTATSGEQRAKTPLTDKPETAV